MFPVPKTDEGSRVAFLAGCHACGLLFTNPSPLQQDLQLYYSRDGSWAARRVERMGRLAAANIRRTGRARTTTIHIPTRAKALLDALSPYLPVYDPPSGARVLDYGCGDGKFLDRFQDLGWETFGIEPSTDTAFSRHGHLDSPPQDASFDFVFLNHVLEHISAPLELLSQLAGALKEGGVMFVSVPRVDTLPVHGDFDYCISGRRHLRCFSEACLRGLLARAGFRGVGCLDAPALDAVFTDGKPLRLRLVAVRTRHPDPLPDAPLAPAVEALARYARGREGVAARMRRLLPVRLRGGLLNRASARRVLARQQESVSAPGRQQEER